MAAVKTYLALLCLTQYCLCLTLPENRFLFEKVLIGVERAAKFFSEDYSDLNVDGLYGLRLAEGQIIEAVKECEKKDCEEELVDTLRRLKEIVSTTSFRSLPYLQEADADYYKRFLPVIDKPYLLEYTPHHFHELDNVKIGTYEDYEEEYGDMCYARLIGSYTEQGRKIPRCNATTDCWHFMTKGNTVRYFITHQLLYFVLAEHLGCPHAFDEFTNQTNPREVLNRMCKNIYVESTKLVENGSVNEMDQDLFLEQTVLCGTLGYEDFQRPDWMHMVLKWQRRDGCFAMPLVAEYLEKESTGRKLLREAAMKDGCLAHKSGLGFSVLATYLRYLVHTL
ncbi:UPF0764 protein C16orf89 homolog [Patella vulgata]|uniref:UPF0764 protein C16orf89 homolog n=1 Tax=Patella vulgata TaxID=6465 RepID=UPI00217F4C23|nr:UPF0764 protein C16orf89 homolog [Patella vulgata]